MTLSIILLCLSCMAGAEFIIHAAALKDSTTYALRNGMAIITWEIDRSSAAADYVDVINPMNTRMFKCHRTDPIIISGDLDRKYKFSGNCSNGLISFLVYNITDGDAGQYISVSGVTNEVIGSQLLVVFAPFLRPDISRQKNAREPTDSGLTMSCHVNATGTPPGHFIPVNYTWKRNGETVESSTKYMVEYSKLKIKSLQRSDLGSQFTCLAWNDYGALSPESTVLEISQYCIYLGSCEMSCVHGYCEMYGDETKCICEMGWAGLNCSSEIDECSSNPCYRGTCYDKYTEYLCVCAPGWTGKQCETDIDDCVSGPCINGGSCNDLGNGYACQCAPDWTGDKCEKAHGNLTSSTDFITAAVGGGCIIIAVFLTILCICYRKHKPGVNMNQMNIAEEIVNHGFDGVQSMHYWTIDGEQLYGTGRRVKSNESAEEEDTTPSNCNQLLRVAGDLESVKDEIETERCTHPTIAIFVNSEFEDTNILTNRQTLSSGQDCEDLQIQASDINLPDCNACPIVDEDIEHVKVRIEPDTDGYLHPIIPVVLNSGMEGKNVLRNSQNTSSGHECSGPQVEPRDTKPFDCNSSHCAERDRDTAMEGIKTGTDGYVTATI